MSGCFSVISWATVPVRCLSLCTPKFSLSLKTSPDFVFTHWRALSAFHGWFLSLRWINKPPVHFVLERWVQKWSFYNLDFEDNFWHGVWNSDSCNLPNKSYTQPSHCQFLFFLHGTTWAFPFFSISLCLSNLRRLLHILNTSLLLLLVSFSFFKAFTVDSSEWLIIKWRTKFLFWVLQQYGQIVRTSSSVAKLRSY